MVKILGPTVVKILGPTVVKILVFSLGGGSGAEGGMGNDGVGVDLGVVRGQGGCWPSLDWWVWSVSPGIRVAWVE